MIEQSVAPVVPGFSAVDWSSSVGQLVRGHTGKLQLFFFFFTRFLKEVLFLENSWILSTALDSFLHGKSFVSKIYPLLS